MVEPYGAVFSCSSARPRLPHFGHLAGRQGLGGGGTIPPPSEGLMSCPSPSLGGPRCDLMQFLSEFVICFLSHPRGPAALLFLVCLFKPGSIAASHGQQRPVLVATNCGCIALNRSSIADPVHRTGLCPQLLFPEQGLGVQLQTQSTMSVIWPPQGSQRTQNVSGASHWGR